MSLIIGVAKELVWELVKDDLKEIVRPHYDTMKEKAHDYLQNAIHNEGALTDYYDELLSVQQPPSAPPTMESFMEQEAQLKEFFAKQEQDRQQLAQREDFLKADALDKERQTQELFARQEAEKQQLFAQQQAADERAFQEMAYQRELHLREQAQQQERLREEIEAQRQREAQEQAKEKAEPVVAKPDYADVQKAEALRNAMELKAIEDAQKQALEDALKRTEKQGLGPEELEAKREELRKAVEARMKELQEAKQREQELRAQRLEDLYRGGR